MTLHTKHIAWIASLFLMCTSMTAMAEPFYQWVENGRLVYGDRPPSNVTFQPFLSSEQRLMKEASDAMEAAAVSPVEKPVLSPEELARKKAEEDTQNVKKMNCAIANDKLSKVLGIPADQRAENYAATLTAAQNEVGLFCK